MNDPLYEEGTISKVIVPRSTTSSRLSSKDQDIPFDANFHVLYIRISFCVTSLTKTKRSNKAE